MHAEMCEWGANPNSSNFILPPSRGFGDVASYSLRKLQVCALELEQENIIINALIAAYADDLYNAELIKELNSSANARIDKLVESINVLIGKPEKYSISNFLDEISTIEGLTCRDYLKLFEVFEKPTAREWYMEMPSDIRRKWILDFLNK